MRGNLLGTRGLLAAAAALGGEAWGPRAVLMDAPQLSYTGHLGADRYVARRWWASAKYANPAHHARVNAARFERRRLKRARRARELSRRRNRGCNRGR